MVRGRCTLLQVYPVLYRADPPQVSIPHLRIFAEYIQYLASNSFILDISQLHRLLPFFGRFFLINFLIFLLLGRFYVLLIMPPLLFLRGMLNYVDNRAIFALTVPEIDTIAKGCFDIDPTTIPFGSSLSSVLKCDISTRDGMFCCTSTTPFASLAFYLAITSGRSSTTTITAADVKTLTFVCYMAAGFTF